MSLSKLFSLLAFWKRKKDREEVRLKALHEALDLLDKTKASQPACLFPCPSQQEASHACICINCKHRGKCAAEIIVASAQDCENRWVKYCSLRAVETNNPNMIVNRIMKDILFDAKRRLIVYGAPEENDE